MVKNHQQLQIPYNDGKSVAVFSNRDCKFPTLFNLIKIKGEQKEITNKEAISMLRNFKRSYKLNHWTD